MKQNILFLTKKNYDYEEFEDFNVTIKDSYSTVKNKINFTLIDSDDFNEINSEKDNTIFVNNKISKIKNNNNIIYNEKFSFTLLKKFLNNLSVFQNHIQTDQITSILFENKSDIKDIDNIVEKSIIFFNLEKSKIKFNFDLLLRELITNAIRHGNKNDINLKFLLHIIMNRKDKKILIITEDCGDGFNLANSLNKNKEILRDGKRGLFILKELSNKFYNKKNKVFTEITF